MAGNRSLTRCQFVAFGAGVFACVALVGVMFLQRSLNEDLYRPAGRAASLVPLAVLTLIPAAIACWVAIYSRPYRMVVFITTLVPAFAAFLIGYLSDIRDQVEASARHAMTGGMLGYAPPLHLVGQAYKAGPLLLWAAVAGVLALGVKRALVGAERGERAEPDGSKAFSWFLGGLGILVVGGLVVYWGIQIYQNTPGSRVASAERILSARESPDYRRAGAIFDIGWLRHDGATQTLRKAATEQAYPLNVLAAGFLAKRNDISALPLLETQLMKSATLKGNHFDVKLGLFLRGITNPEAVPVLTRLMKAEDPATRRGAASALREIGGTTVIDPLVAGLDDPDWEVRWIAVLGLAETVERSQSGKRWGPSHDEFEKNEQLYLDHWKEWAARRERWE